MQGKIRLRGFSGKEQRTEYATTHPGLGQKQQQLLIIGFDDVRMLWTQGANIHGSPSVIFDAAEGVESNLSVTKAERRKYPRTDSSSEHSVYVEPLQNGAQTNAAYHVYANANASRRQSDRW